MGLLLGFIIVLTGLTCVAGLVLTVLRRDKASVPREEAETREAESSEYSVYRIRGLRREYRTPAGIVVALHGASIDIGEGLTAILGPSGQGKSTFLNCIGGLDSPTAGLVAFKGDKLPHGDEAAMQSFRATKVAWVFQDLNLISHQTAVENAALPLLCRGVARREALERAGRNMALVGVGDLRDRYPHQLSGGQKQRVAIARALTSDAEVILADEPTGSLDPETSESVMKAFRDLATKAGKPVVLVTHNHVLARKYCDRIIECTSDGLRDVTQTASCKEPRTEAEVKPSATNHPKSGRRFIAMGYAASPRGQLFGSHARNGSMSGKGKRS